jgi:hypothetical protein
MKRISSYQKTCLYIFGCIALMIWATAAADSKPNVSTSIQGFHTRLYPGAIRVDLLPKPQPARYQGKISGETMRLKVTLFIWG